jgi:Bacterial Ig-like domain
VELNTCTTTIDSILAVYTGSSLGTLSRVADNNNACPNNPDGSTNWGSKITFNATNGTTYRIAVGDAGGLRENTFTLRLIDRTPPRVTSTSPATIGTTANVTATFSEAMRASTINTTTFKLRKSGTSTNLSATVTYNATTKQATLNPSANLQSGATYVATVTTGAKDVAGNSLDQSFTTAGNQAKSWSFKVG